MLASLFLARKKKGSTLVDAIAESRGTSARVSPSSESSSQKAKPQSPGKIRRGLSQLNIDAPAGGSDGRQRAKVVQELTTSLQDNMAGMRSRLVDVEALNDSLKLNEVELQMAMGESEEAKQQLSSFVEEMQGDFKLMARKPHWQATVDSFLSAALGQDDDVPATTPALAEFLCKVLAQAEPSVAPHAAAVVAWHPADHEMLKVFHATDEAEVKSGQNLRDKGNDERLAELFKVMQTGQAVLSNAHGLERDSKAGRSICPLKSTRGVTFACLVSGPPSVPDELLDLVSRSAGPLLERVWKQEKAYEGVANVISFLKQASLDNHQLIYPKFAPKKKLLSLNAASREAWQWQPLAHRPSEATKFEMELKWRLGEPIGVLSVETGTFTEMNEHMVVLLASVAEAVQSALDELEHLIPGDTPPLKSVQEVLRSYDQTQARIPAMLQDEVAQQLRVFDANKIFSEIASFEQKALDDDQRKLLQGILVLLGSIKKKDSKISDWKAMQKLFKKPQVLHEAMLKMPLGDEGGKWAKLWDDSMACTKGVDYNDLTQRSPAPLVVLIRWLQTVRMVHTISRALASHSKPAPPNPIADKIFDLIDVNSDGSITSSELVAYLLKEFPSNIAHALLRVVDTDHSGSIDRQEWRKGWETGMLSKLLIKEAEKEKLKNENQEEGGRLRRKRGGGVMALTAAAAAEQFREKHPELAGGGAGPSSAASAGKVVLPPLQTSSSGSSADSSGPSSNKKGKKKAK